MSIQDSLYLEDSHFQQDYLDRMEIRIGLRVNEVNFLTFSVHI